MRRQPRIASSSSDQLSPEEQPEHIGYVVIMSVIIGLYVAVFMLKDNILESSLCVPLITKHRFSDCMSTLF